MGKATYIFSVRLRDDDRKRAFEFILRHVRNNSDFDILIVEQDRTPQSFQKEGARHIFLYNPGPFNKGWSYNVAINHCQTDKMIFGDGDMYMDMEHLKKCAALLDQYEMVDPKSRLVDLSQEQTNRFYSGIVTRKRELNYDMVRQGLPSCGGIVLFTLAALEKIYNWPESCRGWGAEDEIQTVKANTHLKQIRKSDILYHMYHDRGTPQEHPLFDSNMTAFNTYKRMHHLLNNYMQFEGEIGNPDKYKHESGSL